MSYRIDDERSGLQAGGGPPFVRSAIADYYKRIGGLLPVTIFIVLIIDRLSRSPRGHVEPVPLFVSGASLIILSTILTRWLRPKAVFWKWALRWLLAFGILFCLAAPLVGI